MSNIANNGSAVDLECQDPNLVIDASVDISEAFEAPEFYSTLDCYTQQAESHEQTVLGYGPSDSKKARSIRMKKARRQIKEAEKKLKA